jgi:cholesterol transport system auxiliary component
MNTPARSLLVALALSLGGCLDGLRPPAQTVYDFGPAPRVTQTEAGGDVRMPPLRVAAPSWLSGTAMHYRLAYADGSERREYAESRWAAAPAEMLAHQLRRRLAGADFPARCELAVELVEFEQLFVAPAESRLRLAVQATLQGEHGRPLRTASFDLEEPAAPADARGGATAAARAIDELGRRMGTWLKTHAAACKR